MTTILAAGTFLVCLPVCAMHTSGPIPRPSHRPSMPVVIDAGHGGDDFGASVKGLREKDIALAVALKLKARLKKLPVVLTRETDRYVDLDERVINSVDWNGALFISIHLNEVRSHKTSGATIYSYGPDRRRRWRRRSHPDVLPLPAPPLVAAKEGEFLARSMEKFLREAGIRAETEKSDYYVLKNPSAPSVLVELGFLSNPEESAKLAGAAYQNLLVESLARAIEDYVANRALKAE